MAASAKPSSNLLEEEHQDDESHDNTLIPNHSKRSRSLSDLLSSNEEVADESDEERSQENPSPKEDDVQSSPSKSHTEEEDSSPAKGDDSVEVQRTSRDPEEDLAPLLQLVESDASPSVFFDLPMQPNRELTREVALVPCILDEMCLKLDAETQESLRESMLIDCSAESLQDVVFSLAWRLSGNDQPDVFAALSEDPKQHKELREFLLKLGSDVSYKPMVMASILSDDSMALSKARQRATFLFLVVVWLLARFSHQNTKFVRTTVPMPKRELEYFGAYKKKNIVKQLCCDGSRVFSMAQLLYRPFVYEYLAQQNPKFSHGQVRQILCESAMWGALTGFDTAGDCLYMCTISSDYILNTWWPYIERLYHQKGHPLAFTFKTLVYYKAESYVCLSTDEFEETIAKIPHAFFDRFHTIKSLHSEYRAFEKCKDLPRRSVRVKKQRKS